MRVNKYAGKFPVKPKNKHKIAIIFLSISLNMCFGCSKEMSHGDGSFEYPQHMFCLRNKNIFQLHTLIWGPACLYEWTNKGTLLQKEL